ncbi:DNA-directed RNA polymeras-like proteines i [Bimuria novae-zelandiae CBS 107.79]|uniref:DNA-directed RNA polymerases I, II, and III subunit RPABC3 n=1 Tax=Bimuria novae-zelandiae CBS 107.79 TaxID=1447943 RepID=A0A6A5UG34_9PLEO|nr:DNA-directed RNA polymeras-like proteines i [Bimuria novae-zelandiae CBS 107.79]
MADAQIFEDTFIINDVNAEKYDRVARLKGVSQDNSVDLILDINTELYPVERGETLTVVLANTLRLDGIKDDAKSDWRNVQKGSENTLADMFDYVCYGKVYRVTGEESSGNSKVYLSFGGLLLVLSGPYRKLTGLKIEHLYMLVKRV